LRVCEQRKRDPARRRERVGLVEAAGRQREHLDALAADLVVPLAQLREMPAAERSTEGAHEHEQDLLASAIVGQPDAAAAGAREREVGGVGTNAHTLRLGWHRAARRYAAGAGGGFRASARCFAVRDSSASR